MYSELIMPHAETPETDALSVGSDLLAEHWQALQAGDWPVRMAKKLLPDLLRLAPDLPPDRRCDWLDGLRKLWTRHSWALRPDGQAGLLELAAEWCDWPLAAAVGEAMAEQNVLDDASSLLLIRAYRQLGNAESAIDLAVTGQLTRPGDMRFASAYRELTEWQVWRDSLIHIDGERWGDDELSLEPLAPHHLPDFAWQYYDPDIAKLCCLPSFASNAQWNAWLHGNYQTGDQRVFAVLHRNWGFVGCVSLTLCHDIGFFYYWIGCDFQGRGLGPRAVELMLTMATEYFGMRTCYAKVYEHNTPSRRALKRIGFEDIAVAAVAPDDKEIFYRRGGSITRGQIALELHWLMEVIDSATVPAIMLVPDGVSAKEDRHE